MIAGADGAPWLTDSGQNAIVRVDPKTRAVKLWKLPESSGYANLNTAIFDNRGIHWFTGQSGIYGRLDPRTGDMKVFDAPKGRGPYGIHAAPDGTVYYASLAGSFVGKIDSRTDKTIVIEPPTRRQGARRVWADSKGYIWVAEWNSGNLAYSEDRQVVRLAGARLRPALYAVYVDRPTRSGAERAAGDCAFDRRSQWRLSFSSPATAPTRRRARLDSESGADKIVVDRFQ